MIRLVFALRRKPELSLAEFHDYWRRRHGPLLAGLAEDLNILRYVQTHTIADGTTEGAQRARGKMEPHYDGVEEVWWSSEAGLEAILASDVGRAAGAALLADEAEFIDLPRSPLWFAYEYPQVNPSPENVVAQVKSNVVRVFYPLRHRQSLTEEQARHYWLTHHGPIVRSHAQAAGTLCYRRCIEPTRPWTKVSAPTGVPSSNPTWATRRRGLTGAGRPRRKRRGGPGPPSSRTSATSSTWNVRPSSTARNTRSSTVDDRFLFPVGVRPDARRGANRGRLRLARAVGDGLVPSRPGPRTTARRAL